MPRTILQLIDAGTCYQKGAITEPMQLALVIEAKVYKLQAVGGTDYRSDIDALITAGNCPPLSDDRIDATRVAIEFANAVTAGATVPTTVQAKVDWARCLVNVPGGMLTLRRIELELDRALGANG